MCIHSYDIHWSYCQHSIVLLQSLGIAVVMPEELIITVVGPFFSSFATWLVRWWSKWTSSQTRRVALFKQCCMRANVFTTRNNRAKKASNLNLDSCQRCHFIRALLSSMYSFGRNSLCYAISAHAISIYASKLK